jgi:AMIN domain
MNRTRLVLVLLLVASLGAAQSTAGGAAEIEQLQVKREGADVTIQVILTSSVKPTVDTAINPDRLVLVLPGTLSDAKQKHFPLDANGVRGVRVGLNSANPPVTRVVVDLSEAHSYTLNAEGTTITLRVQSTETAAAARRNGPVPAASAPLMNVFRRKPQEPATEAAAAPAPVPVPPKFPPINFPQPASPTQPAATTSASVISTPSATHPKLGSLQQGTVFPGQGTPGAGTVPNAQNAAGTPGNVNPGSNPSPPAVAVQTAAAPSPAPSPKGNPPASIAVSIAAANTAKPNPGVTTNATATPSGTSAPSPSGATTGSGTTPAVATAQATAAVGVPATSGSSPSSAGAANITAKVLSATVAPANAPPAPAQDATVANPLGTSQTTSAAAFSNSAASATPTQGATVANPLGTSSPAANTAAISGSAVNTTPPTQQGATVANPLGLPQSGATEATASTPSGPQGATVSNPLGLAPGEKAEVVTVESEPADSDKNADANNVVADSITVVADTNPTPPDKNAPKAVEPETPAALALRATHPDFRTTFRVKYVAAGAAYLDGGRGAGLAEGMKLVVRETPTGSVVAAASGKEDNIVAELEVTSVADASAVTDVHTPKRDIKAGDLAYLSAQDEQALVSQNTLSATRKYPTVISFTEGDTLDEEARVQVPRPPMPSVNRARGRIGFDYMGTQFRGATGGSNTSLGLVARLDMTRIGGTYWNANGYWRGSLTANSYSGTNTLQDLINRTYHIGMTYDNPNSPWVAGFGRMYLPWATSLDTIDGGYFGRRMGHGSTLGMFLGSTPDPTSWSYAPNRRIGGVFVNFEGGSYDDFRYTSTSGVGVSTLGWKIDRPFIFFENGIYYKRYVSIYDSLQADSPVGYTAGGSPGAGIGRNFLTVRYQPHERVEFDGNYSYFRDLPAFDPTLVGTSLLDKYLFQGFSGGVRLEVLKQVWVYTNLGRSNTSSDTKSSLNQLYGITFGRLPWVGIRADGHYARFNSSFGNGSYESISLSRSLSENFRLELLGGKQDFASALSSNTNSKFVTSNLEMNVGSHYFMQGGFTVSRGVSQDYDQWLFTLGYRFDTRRAKGQ